MRNSLVGMMEEYFSQAFKDTAGAVCQKGKVF